MPTENNAFLGYGSHFNKVNRKYQVRLSKITKAPAWYRIGNYAQGKAKANGHYPIARGELENLLGNPEMKPQNLDRVINQAVSFGMLDRSSNRRCLVVHTDIEYGIGNAQAECPVRHRD